MIVSAPVFSLDDEKVTVAAENVQQLFKIKWRFDCMINPKVRICYFLGKKSFFEIYSGMLWSMICYW